MRQRERSAHPLTAWRIVARQWADAAFDGEGARLYGGRWNHPGTPVVYASASLSLAALEVFVHADPDTAPPDLVAVRTELPGGAVVERLTAEDLPDGWRAYPGPESLRDLGMDWAVRGETLALVVPSAIVPQEHNVLLNPRHSAFSMIRPEAPIPFGFDPRMWKI